MTHIAVVAPVYNEEQNVEEFTNRVSNELKQLTKEFKIILIDDGSKDNSWQKIAEICSKNQNVKGIKLSKNFGHHYAITAGLNHAEADWSVVMDTDLQDRPEVIPELYKKAQEGFDIVFVSRIDRPESFFYKLLQKIFYFILKISSGIKFDSSQANFSIISRKVVNAFNKFPEQARFYGSTILWLGFKRTSINAKHGSRFKGKPSYNFRKRIKLANDIILSFSDRPLKFAVVIGLIFSAASLLATFYIIYRVYFHGFSVTGWASLMTSIFLVGGVQISIMGIIGIYISKVFNEVKSRPLYLIEQQIN
jgi:dolichol-phosphate mannosyltransferase